MLNLAIVNKIYVTVTFGWHYSRGLNFALSIQNLYFVYTSSQKIKMLIIRIIVISIVVVIIVLLSFLDCGTIHELEHGYANFSGQKTTYDSRIPVYCRKGYFREGNDFLRCTENGTWSNDTQCHIVRKCYISLYLFYPLHTAVSRCSFYSND